METDQIGTGPAFSCDIPGEYFQEPNLDKWTKEDVERYMIELYRYLIPENDEFSFPEKAEVKIYEKTDGFEHRISIEREDDERGDKGAGKNNDSYVLALYLSGPTLDTCCKYVAGMLTAEAAPQRLKNHPFYKWRFKWHLVAILMLILSLAAGFSLASKSLPLAIVAYLVLNLPTLYFTIKAREYEKTLKSKVIELLPHTGFSYDEKDVKQFLSIGLGMVRLFSKIITGFIWIIIIFSLISLIAAGENPV